MMKSERKEAMLISSEDKHCKHLASTPVTQIYSKNIQPQKYTTPYLLKPPSKKCPILGSRADREEHIGERDGEQDDQKARHTEQDAPRVHLIMIIIIIMMITIIILISIRILILKLALTNTNTNIDKTTNHSKIDNSNSNIDNKHQEVEEHEAHGAPGEHEVARQDVHHLSFSVCLSCLC